MNHYDGGFFPDDYDQEQCQNCGQWVSFERFCIDCNCCSACCECYYEDNDYEDE